jgi:branched-chain amino acid transport system substrate-binding protein
VLALSILLNIKGQRHISIPWVCELIGLLAIVVGDSWFAIIVLTAFVDEIWISAVLISSHYMMLAGGLVWYLRYSVKWNLNWSITENKRITNLKRSKRIIVSTVFVLAFSILMGSLYFSNFDISSGVDITLSENGLNNSEIAQLHGNGQIILLGAIVPQTGSLSSIGKPIVTSLNMAERDINDYYDSINSTVRIKLITADSKTSPESTLAAIKQLFAAGVKVVVGPATSTAVAAVKDYAASNNITLISYASTSPALSIEDDNIFRLVPDDKMQGKIISERMKEDGIKVIVPFWRADIYGDQLVNATKLNFENIGGKVDKGVEYKPHTGKFATSLHRINFIMWNQELKKLNSMVSEEISKYGANSVGVYVVAFDEITPILIQAQLFDPLAKVRWYGSDSVAENHHIIKNIDSGLFASETNFTNPLYSTASESLKYKDFAAKLGQIYHDTSITYPALAYDALWIAAKTLENYTNQIDLKQSNAVNAITINEILVDVAKSFDGVSGKINLNKAGDRISENYDFWKVERQKHGDNYYWTKI